MRCAKGQSALGWCGQARVSRGACVCVVFEASLGCLASSAFFVWCSPAGGCSNSSNVPQQIIGGNLRVYAGSMCHSGLLRLTHESTRAFGFSVFRRRCAAACYKQITGSNPRVSASSDVLQRERVIEKKKI
jgi:hypothetical protein